MRRSGLRLKNGSIKKQAIIQGVVMPIRTTIRTAIRTISKRKSALKDTNATPPSDDIRSIHRPPSDVGDSGAGSSPTPVGSSKSHLLLEDNLPTAPVPKINPRLIAVIREKDEDLQSAVVYQNSKLFKSKGQWVVEPLL